MAVPDTIVQEPSGVQDPLDRDAVCDQIIDQVDTLLMNEALESEAAAAEAAQKARDP